MLRIEKAIANMENIKAVAKDTGRRYKSLSIKAKYKPYNRLETCARGSSQMRRRKGSNKH